MSAALPEGTTIGGFVIEGILGRGGMGAVYRARSPRGEAVALKLMADEDADDLVARERFKREAAAAGTVVHPNVIRALGAGEHGRSLWIAFELAPGGSLADLVKRGPLPWREAARLGAEIARALEAIHGAGVVHRDLKPANVLLDGAGQARVTDFGIARNQLGTGHALTRTGELIGTPEYLAPEQIDRARSVDGRADLYSLGVVLHALVSGAPPFVGNALTVMKAQITKPAPPLPRTVSAPSGFAALVARLLEKDPERRPQSAGEVARALDAIAAGEGARSKAPLFALGAVLVAALAAAVVFTQGSRAVPPPPPAHLDAPSPPSPPAAPATPSWFLALPEDERPRLPLPAGVSFGKRPLEYVATRDSTLVLVFVPGGEFDMGEDTFTNIANRVPVHRVALGPFFIGKYEVTIGQFRRFAKTLAAPLPRAKWGYFDRTPTHPDEPSASDPKGGTKEPVTLEDLKTFARFEASDRTWEHPYDAKKEKPTPADVGDARPVTEVTARDALAYAAWLGLELPTEARWEYAAAWDRKAKQRVGRFTWGDAVPGFDAREGRLANLIDVSLTGIKGQSPVFPAYDDGERYAADVGSFARDRSPAGVYDMTGNVREICRDRYDARFYERSPARDPECTDGDADDLRVLRGGSWGWHGGTDGGALSLAVRDPMEFASNLIGFRVAAPAP